MIEHCGAKPVWPIVGQKRRFVPVGEGVIGELEAFSRGREELRRIHATLRAISDMSLPKHPKLSKMQGSSNAFEFKRFGQQGQGRLYLYRTRLEGADTFLICLFRRKKKDDVEPGIEEEITRVAKQFIDRCVPATHR
jgi:hypothetical protein